MTADAVPAIRRFVIVALIVPGAIALVGVVIQLALLPVMPATIAMHWNGAGEADGFAPVWTQPLVTVGFGIGVSALIGLTTLPGLRSGGRGATYRLMGAVAAGTSALVVTAATWTFAMQAGPAGGAEPPTMGWSMIGSVAAGVLVGVVAWFAQPAQSDTRAADEPAAALPLEQDERAVWLRTTSVAPGVVIALAIAVGAVGVSALVAWITGASAATCWTLTMVTVLVFALTAANVAFRVRVDATGLRVDSVLGLPRLRVPIHEVASVSCVFVDPMGEFGGWGLRLSPDRRFGVVQRRGAAIEVTRRNGKRFVVTVDDAETGARLLQALVGRVHS
ncbi:MULTISPECIES: DUF1648 domain-containing protein [unclassified Microbacterium]|uniref:DUF1648 domain-containing protein n=1 Tax=unclassified Microbacterium TaxID=2609290 RepID=UPI00214B586F|nr:MULTISPECIES: DUF1648 domain-containing protein [unclassified Microbacterium]MCR2809685.1 DUF1648 domain-containing protein [Microbacterium sp. zg.B185]WIM17995.1 DUF1648 domain-containing protein [Microbacterium sp. zg-B185]